MMGSNVGALGSFMRALPSPSSFEEATGLAQIASSASSTKRALRALFVEDADEAI
jgi:hypothetical protein